MGSVGEEGTVVVEVEESVGEEADVMEEEAGVKEEEADMKELEEEVEEVGSSVEKKIPFVSTSRVLFIFLCTSFLFSKLLTASWFPKSLPCDVTVEAREAVIVDCSERHLTSIPEGIPSNTTNLTLTINHIPRISLQSFAQLRDLIEIDFRCNCIPVILGPKDHVCTKRLIVEDGSFASLYNLRSLYLDGNQLSTFPKVLPSNLVLLSLEVNNIFSISRENLSELSNIQMLYLGQNCYYRNPCNVSFFIEKEAFNDLKNLTVLSMKSNNLSFVPDGLSSSLKELYLYNNKIQSINDHDFQNLTNLEILDLSGNCPRCYNSPFPCIPCPGNAPLKIDCNAFVSLKNLKTLRLQSNSLRIISRWWFKNTKNLQVLDLSQNFLATEIGKADFLKLVPKLKDLDLSFNFELQKYPVELHLSPKFSNLTSLESLRIRGYVFQELKSQNLLPLVNLKNLSILDLGTNFIKVANFSLFQKMSSLKIIGLSNNKISPSGESNLDSCSDSSVSSVNNHYIPRIDSTIQDVHYFQYDEHARRCKSKVKEGTAFHLFVNEDCQKFGATLDLSQNNIFFVKSADFQQLSFLKCLNLSGNAISQTLNGTEFKALKNLQYLDFSNNRIDLLYSTAFQELTELRVLDISNNKHYFIAEGITHMLNFTKNLKKLRKLMMNDNEISFSTNNELISQSLHTLEFKGNRLDLLWKDGNSRYYKFFNKLSNLKDLDISYNYLSFIPPGVFEGMPPNLKKLCLVKNNLKTFNWGKLYLLEKLVVLDLSSNYLTTVPRELSNCTNSIERFILRDNKIKRLTTHFLRNAFTLKYLDLSNNKIEFIGKSSFPEEVLNNLSVLLLQGNPFKCNCDAVWLVSWINRTTVTIPNLVTDVICAGPGTHKGQSLVLLDLYTCEQDNLNLIIHAVSASFILCLMVICVSSHLFYWDFWYIYHFFKAKLKVYKQLPKVSYDALIVYDTKDSEVTDWVFNELVEILEDQEDKMFNLCLEERDWIPGLPFLDNLSESIYLSRKTVFVLTNKYIRSGHFRTAFYIAHQRLIEERVDVIILIFLEKTLQNSRYLRLRKRLCGSSVLYWPSNPNAHMYFWHCLRNVLAIDNQMAYDKHFKERPNGYYAGAPDQPLIVPVLHGLQPQMALWEVIRHNLQMETYKARLLQVVQNQTFKKATTMDKKLNLILSFLCLLQVMYSSKDISNIKQDNMTIPCTISENSTLLTFDCHERWLRYVPFPIVYKAKPTVLLLSNNLIQAISKESFQDWHNLTKIDLNSNHYSKGKLENSDKCKAGLKIQNGTFSNLTQLQELLLDYNYLCEIPRGLPKTLRVLSLQYNNIYSVTHKCLMGLQNLNELNLEHNCHYSSICSTLEIQQGAFADLQQLTVLRLSFNNITTVPPDLPPLLRQLYLSNNNIKVIARDDFKNMVSLEVLHLSGNCPRCFNAAYQCESCKDESSIEIDAYAFQSLRNLTELNLGSTSLTHVPSIWFQNTTRLKVLNLQLNYLVKEMTSAEFLLYLPLLEKLDLSYNYEFRSYVKNINISDNFSKLVSLQELRIQGYVFKECTATDLAPLTKLKKLNIINLGVNFIRQIDFRVFQKFSNLTLIYLSENKITPYSENTNQSKNIETFQTYNKVQHSMHNVGLSTYAPTLLKSFGHLEKPKCSSYGKTLDLSLNSIFFIDPEQFKAFSDIKCLNLSSNGLGQDVNGTEFIYLSKLLYLDLSFNKLDLGSLYAFSELSVLEVLDLSYNQHYFVVEGVTHHLNFIQNLKKLKILNLGFNQISTLTDLQCQSHSLEELIFSGNRLDVLWKNGDSRYMAIFKNLYSLKYLDISHNRLHTMTERELGNLPSSLTMIYLNNNELNYFDWKSLIHFPNLKILDLSHNRLTMIIGKLSNYTTSLHMLLLNNNMIQTLPVAFLHNARSLTNLDLSHNHLQNINKSVFLSGSENYLKMLWLKENPFDCTCEITDFLNWIKTNNVIIPRLATDVTCATPTNRKRKGIIYFDAYSCNLDNISMIMFLLTFFLVIHITVLPLMKHLFYWDLWFIYHLCMAKLRLKKVCSSESFYDAFIAYDNKDPAVSDWIFNELCHHLENKGDKHILLCLEERDWEPGKAVIDNLVQSINQSKKTMFVLTKKYVKSGKFKTAFYLALQKLMDENMDVIVIVLLQPVLQNSQYLRLRKRICKSSILEWPKNPYAEGLFWQRMRNVLLTDNGSRYNRLYTNPLSILK
ncbi:uncharacterized protein O3C94_001766 [Discoglossus pictus]